MKIGGFQPITLSDYPGLTAAIVFTQGCNFRCPFCHNGTLLNVNLPEYPLLDVDEILNTLERRKKLLDGLVITGGEPTIQPNLLPFIREVKKMGYKIKLDTNGNQPKILENLILHNVLDYIAMDVKAPLHKYDKLAGVSVAIDNIRKSIAVISHSGVDFEFRTTYVPPLLTENDIDSIRSFLPENATYKVQEFIPENALDESLQVKEMV